MNVKALQKLGIASLVSVGAITYLSPAISSESIKTNIDEIDASGVIGEPGSVRKSKVLSQQTALKTGEFTAAEAPTTGTAKIVESNGQTYLEIDSAFQTGNTAPDLQVLLDTVQPPAAYENADYSRYLNLGSLKSITGEQRYPIPDFVDTSQFASVVIWCRMFNATYGYAPLNNDNSASIR